MKKYLITGNLFCLTLLIITLFGCGNNDESRLSKEGRESMEALVVNAFVKNDKEYFIAHLYSDYKKNADVLSAHVESYERFVENNGKLKNYKISTGEVFNTEINSELIPMASYLVEGQFENSKIMFGISLIYRENEWYFYGFSQK